MTKGRNSGLVTEYVSSYTIKYRIAGEPLTKDYLNKFGNPKIIPGNSDKDTSVQMLLHPPLQNVVEIRIFPRSFEEWPSIRFGTFTDCTTLGI